MARSIRPHIISFLVLLGAHSVVAQHVGQQPPGKNFEMAFGLGFPDLLHAGMKYHITPSNKVAMSVGTLIFTESNEDRSTIAVTLEHEYHFPTDHKRHTFYLSQKLTYIQDTEAFIQTRTLYFTPSIGKVFYSEGPFGVNVDAGLNLKLRDRSLGTMQDQQVSINNFPSVFPAVRLQFFFQI